MLAHTNFSKSICSNMNGNNLVRLNICCICVIFNYKYHDCIVPRSKFSFMPMIEMMKEPFKLPPLNHKTIQNSINILIVNLNCFNYFAIKFNKKQGALCSMQIFKTLSMHFYKKLFNSTFVLISSSVIFQSFFPFSIFHFFSI